MLTPLNKSERERGQVVVFFALLIPVIFAIAAIVIDVGNWYTLRRHLQTQVDAAAFAGGQSLYGCHQDSAGQNGAVTQASLNYAGDPTRDATTKNLQLEANEKVHAVLNSSNYWPSAGSDPNGVGYDWTEVSTDADSPKIGLPGRPCYNGWVDVKATHDSPPLLWGLIPIHPSPKTVARVELQTAVEASGVLPLGLPDNNPTYVAAIIVNMDVAGWQTSAAAQVGSGFLVQPSTPPAGLAEFNVYQGTVRGKDGGIGGVNLNGANNFGVFILTTLDSSPPSLTGSLDTICSQSPAPVGQLECFAYDDSGQELSFIHSYSSSAAPTATDPQLRQAPIFGGCDGSGSNPLDLSRPYFNLNGGCSVTMNAKVDFFGVSGPSNNPTARPSLGGVCADVRSNVGSVSYDGGSSSSWSITDTLPNSGSSTGRYPIVLTAVRYGTNAGGNCNSTVVFSKSLGTAGAPYVADQDGASGPVQYLTVDYLGVPANSIDQPVAANLDVTVGFTPAIVDTDLTDPPTLFRLGDFNTPSQTQALDCDASGAAGWRAKIVSGCQGWAINQRNGVCSPNPPTPGALKDCIDAETGNFTVQQAYKDRFTPDGCAANPNNWNRNGYTLPPLSDPRWGQLFVVDRHGFTVSGKKTYPVRRFVNVYVTAADGFDCPGDVTTDPSTPRPGGQPARRNELWGHVTTYTSGDPGATPSGIKCSFTDGGVCVPVLVK